MLFTKEQLQNSPSRADGVDLEKELSYRQQAASLIFAKVREGVPNGGGFPNTRLITCRSSKEYPDLNGIEECEGSMYALVLT